MADVFTKAKRSTVMAAIRSNGNKETEMSSITIFRKHGIKGWRRSSTVFGKPDFIFLRRRLVVFVDGCFWHACPYHFRLPRSNQAYWRAKVARNKKRDRIVTHQLKLKGWKVLRIWQHQLRNENKVVRSVQRALLSRGLY